MTLDGAEISSDGKGNKIFKGFNTISFNTIFYSRLLFYKITRSFFLNAEKPVTAFFVMSITFYSSF